MSYSITVTVSGGELSTTSTSPVPDGKYVISGHEDDNSLSVSAVVQDVDGKQRATASSWQVKER